MQHGIAQENFGGTTYFFTQNQNRQNMSVVMYLIMLLVKLSSRVNAFKESYIYICDRGKQPRVECGNISRR